MEFHVPHYYNDFVCIADKCIDNCCFGGWEINIDEDTVHYYQSLNSSFSKEIIEHLNYIDEYCFQLKDGHCPFLDSHNLCRIYQNLGANHLGIVCAQFPRYTEYYGNIKESGIGLACEEAARIIFEDTQPFSLKTIITDEPADTSSEYNEEFGNLLFSVRTFFFDLLNQNQYNLHDKLIILINVAYEMQKYINDNDMNHLKILAENLIKDSNKIKEHINVQDNYITDINNNHSNNMNNSYIIHSNDNINNTYNHSNINKSNHYNIFKNNNHTINIEDFMSTIWNIYLDLESINAEWDTIKNETVQLLHSHNKKNYINILNQYQDYILKHTEISYDNLIKYYIYRYFMKSAYDYNVLGKIQLVISNYLIVRELDIARFVKNNSSFSIQDQLDTIHIFSREIEYSEENIEQLYEEFVFGDLFKPKNLTKLLEVL